jgi:hypothetical protein
MALSKQEVQRIPSAAGVRVAQVVSTAGQDQLREAICDRLAA